MITFGYNSRFSSPLKAILVILLGVLMIIAKADAMQMIVRILAAFMLAAGIVSIFVGFKQKKDGTMPLSFFNATVNIVIAVLLFSFSGFVAGFVSYLLGFILFVFGLYQILALLSIRGKVKLGIASYVTPLAVTAVGTLIFLSPRFLGQSLGLIAGIALIIYGISDLISSFKVRSAMESEDIEPSGPTPADPEIPTDAKEVDYEKVDEQ
jgi:uncharacterized membrane protein HdeD (DUF308 family)